MSAVRTQTKHLPPKVTVDEVVVVEEAPRSDPSRGALLVCVPPVPPSVKPAVPVGLAPPSVNPVPVLWVCVCVPKPPNPPVL